MLSGQVDVPAPPLRLLTDWAREISQNMDLMPGDVEVMPLARTRARWPDYSRCLQAMFDWTGALGLPGLLAASDIALMVCRGARYHHDADQYGGAAFCNLFLSEDKGLDVHFPGTDHRIPLRRGTALVFDTAQPHGVIRRHSQRFNADDFATEDDYTQIFLTWELPIEDPCLSQALGLTFDIAPVDLASLDEEQVQLKGKRLAVCPDSGAWQAID